MKDTSVLNKEAVKLRKKWGLSTSELVDLTSILPFRMKDLTVLFYPMNVNISGMCSCNDYGDIIVVNSHNSKGRQRFTIAHELYHLLYEDGFREIVCSTSNSSSVSEINADNFASHFLIPIEGLNNFKENNNIESWGLDEIIFAEQHFQMSHHALLFRLKEEKEITEEDYNNFYDIGITFEAKKRGFDEELYKPYFKGKEYYALGSFIRKTEEAFDNGKITESKKKKLLLDGFRRDIF